MRFGGADRDRTGDPLLAKQVLSQLSYSPNFGAFAKLVGLGRFELPTSPLSGVRSNQLSYRPVVSRYSPPAEKPQARSPAALLKSQVLLQGFGNKVEHAGQLRHP